MGASKWKNQVLVIKKTSNENVKTKEKWKNVSDKKVCLIKWLIFGVLKDKNKSTTLLKKLFNTKKHFSTFPWL